VVLDVIVVVGVIVEVIGDGDRDVSR